MAQPRLVFHVVSVFALLWTAAEAQTPIDCTRNREQTRWFVRAGALGDGAGTNARPFASLADVERCAPAGATITVLAPADGAPPLDGGIRLKDRQKLFGAAPERGGKPTARLTNTGNSGDAITLAHGNEIAHLHIDTPAGAAIVGDNVDGVLLHDLLLTRQSATPPSTLEVHVARSDIIGAAAAGVFTYYFIGRPGRDVIDLGCLNPDPDRTSPDRDACRKLGYTSAGQNRIFGNMRNSKNISPYVEVGLQGPGLMMAQGNYWGDINPVDGKGDALGECGLFDWSGETRDETPVKPLPEARCDLYNIRPQGNPTGVDGRFHLASDPRPAKK